MTKNSGDNEGDKNQRSKFQHIGDAFNKAIEGIKGEVSGKALPLNELQAPRFIAQTQFAQERYAQMAAAQGFSPRHIDESIAAAVKLMVSRDDLCESPIERAILPWLVFEDYGPRLRGPAFVHHPKTDREVPNEEAAPILIIPQFAFIRYRFDFAVIGRRKGEVKIVAVECDGQKFHQDGRRDWERDNYLAAFNIPTIRATGADIHERPEVVSGLVGEQLIGWTASP